MHLMATTEKLLDELTIKLTPTQKSQLVGLCEIKGLSASEAVRAMIERFISESEREFVSMQNIFGNKP